MADLAGGMPMVEDQGRLLEEALGMVRQQASQMRRCLETPGKLMDALKCGSTLVSELRTPTLGPKQYYELYMAVFDALRYLSDYLRDSHPVNHLADLYELVQYAGNIIPRLYLMITVGTVYMGVEDAPVKEIMKDMMEMSRGVQHPIRGLFLRYFLIGQARDYLPQSKEDGPQGNLQDSVNFILTNFVEMNKLWVRWQHQGHSREREQRTQERRELELLVGSNLVRLSQLVDLDTYRDVIIAPLLEQVIQCRDVLAQEYLLEVITKVFPDEYHMHTLDHLLNAIARLNPHVDMKKIVIGLMDRLASYAQRESEGQNGEVKEVTKEEKQKSEEEALDQLLEKLKLDKEKAVDHKTESKSEPQTNGDAQTDGETPAEPPSQTAPAEPEQGNVSNAEPASSRLFEIFYEQVVNLVKLRSLPIQDTTALLTSLANLALNIYPDRLDYVDQVLSYAANQTKIYTDSADLHSAQTQSNMLSLLLSPVRTYVSLFTALSLPSYIPLLQAQSYPTRRAVAGDVAKSVLRNQTKISTPEHLMSMLSTLQVIIKDGGSPPAAYALANQRRNETDEVMEEQGWLARIVHYIQSPDNDTQLKLLQQTRKAYDAGNERIRYTTPAIVTQSLRLARQLKKREHLSDTYANSMSTLYKFIHQTLSQLYTRVQPSGAELSLRLFCAAGRVADQTGHEEASYEFFAQAFTIYEDSVSDSRAQFQAVCVIAGALQQTRGFGRENYDTLITKAALHGSKLLKKPDQCRAVYLASHLWWAVECPGRGEEDVKDLYRDGKRVLECLQRALRVADACMDTAVSVELFVEILGRYVYYFDQGNESVTIKYLNGLIELIHSNLSTSAAEAGSNQAQQNASLENSKKHFYRTLDYIKSREYEGVITEPRT